MVDENLLILVLERLVFLFLDVKHGILLQNLTPLLILFGSILMDKTLPFLASTPLASL